MVQKNPPFAWKIRMLRGDMRGVQNMHAVGNEDRETFFSLSRNTRTWGHPMMLIGGRSRTNKRMDFFTQRIVKLWNSLPQDLEMATNLDGFKRGLDIFLEVNAINGYVSVSEAVSLYTPVAGEHGWEGAVTP